MWFAVMLFFSYAGDPLGLQMDLVEWPTKAACDVSANIQAGSLSANTDKSIVVPLCVNLATRKKKAT